MSMSPHSETSPTKERTADAAVTSRRSFMRTAALGAAALGSVAATGAALTSVAGASESMTSSSGGSSATAAEPSLSVVDSTLLVFLQGVSLAAQQALQSASDATYLSNTAMERLREFGRHHRDQAARLGKLLPTDVAASNAANPTLLSQMNSKFAGSGSQTELLNAVADFEESLSATFIEALGQADHFTVSEAIAGCAPILGQQAASAGADAGQSQSTWMPAFAPTSGALTQSAYPIR
jgi:hypothetical protein